MPQARWKQRPPGSNWGEFGPDDVRGRMNWVTAEKVRQGVAQVREGLSFSLSLPLDVPGKQLVNSRRAPPRLYANVRDGVAAGQQGFCYELQTQDPDLRDLTCDDVVVMTLQYSTQWDSFAHWGSLFDADADGRDEPVFYNGYRAGVDVKAGIEDAHAAEPWMRYPSPNAGPLSIANLAEHGAQGLGVMVDLLHHLGPQRRNVGYDDLMRVLDADGIQVTRGDMVCFHTGYAERLLAMDRNPDMATLDLLGAGLNGRDGKLLNWITDSGAACLIADNVAVENFMPKLLPGPGETVVREHGRLRQSMLPLHEHCLFLHGIHLGEIWRLSPLATWLRAHQRHHFLLTAPALNLPGAVGSPATPIATV